jgi:hypothetical protein
MAFTRPRRNGTGIDGLGLEYYGQGIEMHGLGYGRLYSARATGMGIDGEISRRIVKTYRPRLPGLY